MRSRSTDQQARTPSTVPATDGDPGHPQAAGALRSAAADVDRRRGQRQAARDERRRGASAVRGTCSGRVARRRPSTAGVAPAWRGIGRLGAGRATAARARSSDVRRSTRSGEPAGAGPASVGEVDAAARPSSRSAVVGAGRSGRPGTRGETVDAGRRRRTVARRAGDARCRRRRSARPRRRCTGFRADVEAAVSRAAAPPPPPSYPNSDGTLVGRRAGRARWLVGAGQRRPGARSPTSGGRPRPWPPPAPRRGGAVGGRAPPHACVVDAAGPRSSARRSGAVAGRTRCAGPCVLLGRPRGRRRADQRSSDVGRLAGRPGRPPTVVAAVSRRREHEDWPTAVAAGRAASSELAASRGPRPRVRWPAVRLGVGGLPAGSRSGSDVAPRVGGGRCGRSREPAGRGRRRPRRRHVGGPGGRGVADAARRLRTGDSGAASTCSAREAPRARSSGPPSAATRRSSAAARRYVHRPWRRGRLGGARSKSEPPDVECRLVGLPARPAARLACASGSGSGSARARRPPRARARGSGSARLGRPGSTASRPMSKQRRRRLGRRRRRLGEPAPAFGLGGRLRRRPRARAGDVEERAAGRAARPWRPARARAFAGARLGGGTSNAAPARRPARPRARARPARRRRRGRTATHRTAGLAACGRPRPERLPGRRRAAAAGSGLRLGLGSSSARRVEQRRAAARPWRPGRRPRSR